ncbi:hypothetical protein Ddc_08127 [Ditylenchus destructor]|nr:hypothetical protein Ddc_08127 [Ditylenchus destructor]
MSGDGRKMVARPGSYSKSGRQTKTQRMLPHVPSRLLTSMQTDGQRTMAKTTGKDGRGAPRHMTPIHPAPSHTLFPEDDRAGSLALIQQASRGVLCLSVVQSRHHSYSAGRLSH